MPEQNGEVTQNNNNDFRVWVDGNPGKTWINVNLTPKDQKSYNLEARRQQINMAFAEMFPPPPMPEPVYVEYPEDNRPWVMEYFDDYIVVCDYEADHKYFKVPYTLKGEAVELAPRNEWVEIEPKQEWVEVAKSYSEKRGARNNRRDQERLQAMHDYSVENGAICKGGKALELDEVLVSFGGEVKALGEGRVGGYLVRFSSPSDPDLENDFFTKDTDFGEHEATPIFYQHGMDEKLGKRVIGKGKLKKDEFGIWVEAQIELRDEYEKWIYERIQQNKQGWSSGTAGHLVEREQDGKSWRIKSWPLGLDASITPTPAEPRNSAITLKSLYVSDDQANETPVKSDGETSVTETINLYGAGVVSYGTSGWTITTGSTTNILDAAPALAAKESTMPENEEGKVVETPKPVEIDYDLLAAKVAEKIDVPGAAKSVPAVIKPENRNDPDPVKALTDWARGAAPHSSLKALGAEIDANGKELHFGYTKAALQEDTAGEGGNLVPNDFYAGIIAKRDETSIPRRAGARVFRTSRDYLDIPYEDTSMTNFVKTAEEAAYDQNEPTFGNVQVRIYKYTKLIKMSEELVEDQDANLDSFLTEAIGRSWGLTENDLTLVGSGSSTVQGVFVGGQVGYTFADTNSIAAAEIPALFWSLGSPYHEGATWVTRGATIGELQGLTGNNFQLVSTPPFGGIEQPRFWGAKPYYLSDSVAAIAAAAKTILIGNWNYYALVERRGLTMSRNPYLYQANGQIGLFCSVRMGGAVLQAEAFKYGKQKA